jgi:hypothetical protein
MSFARKLLALFIVVTVTLAAGEGLLRIFQAVVPAPADSPYIPDPNAGFRLRPDLPSASLRHEDERVNNLGFRDREHSVEKPQGTCRILGIGDSFVYGDVRLKDNFLRVTESELAGRLSERWPSVEMVMMGLGGYSPENALGVLRSGALDLSPDLVTLNFFVGNDITGIPTKGRVYRGRLYYIGSSQPVLNVLRKLRIFQLSESAIRQLASIVAQQRLSKGQDDTAEVESMDTDEEETAIGSYPWEDFVMIQARRLPVFLSPPHRSTLRLWDEAEDYLLEFDRLCREADVPWVLHIIPSEVQVDPETRRLVLEALSLSEEAYDFDAPQRRLHDFAEANGITITDPLPELRAQHSRGDRLYIPNNTHWNVKGNRIAGEILAAAVEAELTANGS